MGCDIHPHFEVKINGKWEHYNSPQIYRFYILFGKMAGVRDDSVEPIHPPKGLPNDISVVTAWEAESWDTDGHTHSWFNAYQIAELMDFHESLFEPDERYKVSHNQWGYLFGNGWECWARYPEDRPKGIEDIRLVFWFDN